jgi:hypothetical protein
MTPTFPLNRVIRCCTYVWINMFEDGQKINRDASCALRLRATEACTGSVVTEMSSIESEST